MPPIGSIVQHYEIGPGSAAAAWARCIVRGTHAWADRSR